MPCTLSASMRRRGGVNRMTDDATSLRSGASGHLVADVGRQPAHRLVRDNSRLGVASGGARVSDGGSFSEGRRRDDGWKRRSCSPMEGYPLCRSICACSPSATVRRRKGGKQLVSGQAAARKDPPHRWEGRIMAILGVVLAAWCIVVLPSGYRVQKNFNAMRDRIRMEQEQGKLANKVLENIGTNAPNSQH